MGIEKTATDWLKAARVTETPWQFVTSAGGELAVGTPIARLSVAGVVGALWVKYGRDGTTQRLTYGGVGASAGFSLVPFPANFSFSIPAMPSAGVIYKLPFAGKALSFNELRGPFVMMQVGVDWGPGVSGSVMFIGGNPEWPASLVRFSHPRYWRPRPRVFGSAA